MYSCGVMMVKSFFIILISSLLLCTQALRGYVHVKPKKSWKDAQEYCRLHHNDLAVFGNQTEYEALHNPCGSGKWCWIGLYRENEDLSTWYWSNGEKVSFRSWRSGQPDTRHEMCAKMKDERWYDYGCSTKEEFLCDDEGLILVEEKKTWEEALEHCRTLHNDTTSVNTDTNPVYDLPHTTPENINLYLKDLIQNAQTQDVWIGLRFLAGRWFWVNSVPLEDKLEEELPICPAPMMHCGTMSKTEDTLNTRDCSERRNFLCLHRDLV